MKYFPKSKAGYQRDKWLRIAEAYLTPFSERDGVQKDISESGLCWAEFILNHEHIYMQSNYLFYFHPSSPGFSYWWPVRKYMGTIAYRNFSDKDGIMDSEGCAVPSLKLSQIVIQTRADELRGLVACFIATMPEDMRKDFE